jgi:protein SCO1/2
VKTLKRFQTLSLTLLFTVLATLPMAARAADVPNALEGVGIHEHLGAAVSIRTLHFKDEKGNDVLLSDYFRKNRPVILALVYYECPNLCNLLLNGMVAMLKTLDWTVGNQFDIVTVSINPRETPVLANAKKFAYVKIYGRPESENGWHFLTAEESQVKQLANEIGFTYKYDENEKQYAHAAAAYVLTPEGTISRYLYGIKFDQKDVRLALLEASNGKIGNVAEKVLLFCFHFDPNKNSYTFRIWKVVQIILSFEAMALFLFLIYLKRREKRA